jgi:hypothetical protein
MTIGLGGPQDDRAFVGRKTMSTGADGQNVVLLEAFHEKRNAVPSPLKGFGMTTAVLIRAICDSSD